MELIKQHKTDEHHFLTCKHLITLFMPNAIAAKSTSLFTVRQSMIELVWNRKI